MTIIFIIFYLIGVVLAFGRLAGMTYYYEKLFRKYDEFNKSGVVHKTPFHDYFILISSLFSWITFLVATPMYFKDIDDQHFFKWSYKDLNYE